MKTQIINHAQGTEAWHKHRAQHLNASDAAAVLGLSSYKTRMQLLHEKATGFTAEVDSATQQRFAKGHEFEATARPWAEEIIGSELFPVVLAGEYEGLNLSASLDGADMESEFTFEHKTGRADLLASLDQGVIPDEYHPQMEMGLMLSGASKCLFMASSGNKEAMRSSWYVPNMELRAQIIAAWHQFAIDLAAYVPPAPAEVKPVGKTPETLPALHVEVTGMVTASNLAAYKEHALAVFAGINRELTTEQHFADAEKIVKWCGDVETRLEAAKEHALSQTQSIDELFKAIDDIKAEARRTRLDLDKLVAKRKEEIRTEIVTNGRAAYAQHVVALNKEIAPAQISLQVPDFAGAIKGKRSLDSMRDAVDVALANGKIAADASAKAIRANLVTFHQAAEGYEFLFADLAQLVHKAADDFALVVSARVDARKAAEAKAKEQEAAKASTQAAEVDQNSYASSSPALVGTAAFHNDVLPAANVVAMPARAASPATAPTTAPTLKLGDIAQRLGFTLTGDFLKVLGFEPAAVAGASKLYHDRDFTHICAALVSHINSVQAKQAA